MLTKSKLIDSNAEMPTRRKITSSNHRERLSAWTPRTGDAIVCSYENNNRKKPAEMTGSHLEMDGVTKNADVSFDANVDATNTLGLTN